MKNWFMAGSHARNYELDIDTNTTYHGRNSGYIKSVVAETEGFGSMMQMFSASHEHHAPKQLN